MTTSAQETARRRLCDEAYRPLWAAARARLERTGLSLSNRPIKVAATGDARAAIAGLVGCSPAGDGALSIRLDLLDQTLRAGAAHIDLLSMLGRVDGPLVDRREIRAQRSELTASTWQALATHPAIDQHPRLTEWLDGLRSSGTALRLAGSLDDLEPLARRGLDVLARLPVSNTPLAVFAAELTGDPHALDRSTTLGSLVAGALACIETPTAGGSADDGAAGATHSWREAWARVGVVCDEVSVSVLVLNLVALADGGPVASAVAEHRRVGMPLRLTLQQLRSEPLEVPPELAVRSCENPSVLAQAAASLGPRSAPLVCTDGQPNSAVDELLRQVRAAGAPVHHHGDFDWGGIRIANALLARHQVGLWRFSTPHYLEAVSVGSVPLDPARAPASAPWDPELVPAMQRTARCVFEEQVVSTLIEDLRR